MKALSKMAFPIFIGLAIIWMAAASPVSAASTAAGQAAVSGDSTGGEEPMAPPPKTFKVLSKASAVCTSCHMKENPSIYQQWGASKHYGANIGCYECHRAEEGDADAVRHKDFLISTIVSPKDCAECHSREVAEFDASHHATGGLIIGSLDNLLAEVVEGSIRACPVITHTHNI